MLSNVPIYLRNKTLINLMKHISTEKSINWLKIKKLHDTIVYWLIINFIVGYSTHVLDLHA